MLFTPENAAKVMVGEKMMTRRVCKEGECLSITGAAVISSVFYHKPGQTRLSCKNRVKWMVGRTYAVQPGRGKSGIGFVRLTAIRREKLQDIDHEDIEAEGIPKSLCIYVDQEGYKDFNADEHRYLFEELWDSISGKGYKFADNPDVWVLTFELAEAK